MLVQLWGWFPDRHARLLGVFLLLPVLLPLGFIALRLYREQFESAVTLAMSMGGALFAAEACLLYFAMLWDHRWWILSALIAGLAAQVILIAFSWRLSKFLTPSPGSAANRTLRHAAYALGIFWIFWQYYSTIPQHILDNESEAIRFVAGESRAVDSYEKKAHGGLFAEEQSNLGTRYRPECNSDPLPVNVPADFDLPKGYTFEYRGHRPATTLNGCTWFQGFTITARPSVFRETGIKSYFVDENLRIHFTSENRAAQASDPDTSVEDVLLKDHRPA
jgi:hypothetical protein